MKQHLWLFLGLVVFCSAVIGIDLLQPVHQEPLSGDLIIVNSAYTRPGGALNPLGRKVVLKGIFKGEELRILIPRETFMLNKINPNEGTIISVVGTAYFKDYTKTLKVIRAVEINHINKQPVTTEVWVLDSMFHKDKVAFPRDEELVTPING